MTDTLSKDVDSEPADWPELEWFDALIKLLNQVVSSTEGDEAQLELRPLFPYLDSAHESCETLRLLVLKTKLRDAYVIARVVYETSLNACFLLTDPKVLENRATVHARQKALRNLTRAIRLAGETVFEFKPPRVEEIMAMPRHREWLDQFTSKKGRELPSWTPENVQDRLEAVYSKFGKGPTHGLALGLLIYRNASEIAHGSLYGALFSWGATDHAHPLTGPEGLAAFRRRELRHLLKLMAFSLESVVHIVASVSADKAMSDSAWDAREAYNEKRRAAFDAAKRKE